MIRLIVVLLIVTNSVFGQKPKKDLKNFELLESYTMENYKVPDSILFYAANQNEMSYQYDLIFNRIKNKTKKEKIKSEYTFESRFSSDDSELFYNLETIDYKIESCDVICFFDITTTSEDQKKFCKNGKCVFYFYLTLYDNATKKVMLKRKYQVRTDTYYYTRAKELADLIIKELQLKS